MEQNNLMKTITGKRDYFDSSQPIMEGRLWQPWREEHIARTPHFTCQNKKRTDKEWG